MLALSAEPAEPVVEKQKARVFSSSSFSHCKNKNMVTLTDSKA